MQSKQIKNFTIRNFRRDDEADVIALWQQAGLIVPWNNPKTDIERKHEDSPDMFFIGELGNEPVATCMAGYDGHRGWIYFLAVRNSQQRKGLATILVSHVESELAKIGCPKIDLMVRNTNDSVLAFYKSLGYELDPVVVMSKRLRADEKHAWVND